MIDRCWQLPDSRPKNTNECNGPVANFQVAETDVRFAAEAPIDYDNLIFRYWLGTDIVNPAPIKRSAEGALRAVEFPTHTADGLATLIALGVLLRLRFATSAPRGY